MLQPPINSPASIVILDQNSVSFNGIFTEGSYGGSLQCSDNTVYSLCNDQFLDVADGSFSVKPFELIAVNDSLSPSSGNDPNGPSHDFLTYFGADVVSLLCFFVVSSFLLHRAFSEGIVLPHHPVILQVLTWRNHLN
jgi:hypothetical protein